MAIKKIIHEYNGILMDSQEEVYFAHWLNEAVSAGWVEKWMYVTKPFLVCPPIKRRYTKTTVLKTKIKQEQKEFTILQDLEYTPDFKIKWTQDGINRFVSFVANTEKLEEFDPKSFFFGGYEGDLYTTTWVEVKPNFDMHGKISKFSVLQKILWTFKELFVDLIQIDPLFKETWIPKALLNNFRYKVVPKKAAAKGKKKGDFKVDWKVRTIEEYEKEGNI